MEFKDRLKELRIANGWTLEEVAQGINMNWGTKLNRSTVLRYETGECEPKLVVASYFAQYYGVSLDYLIGLVDDKHGHNDERRPAPEPFVPAATIGQPGRHRRTVARAARMKTNRKKIGGAS